MKREDLPNPTRFVRGLLLTSDGKFESADGPPKHAIIKTEPAPFGCPFDGVTIIMLVHQDGYGPEEVEMPLKDERGKKVEGPRGGKRTYIHKREVPQLSDIKRYAKVTIPRERYESLPTCSYTLMGRYITDIREVPNDQVQA